MNEPTTIDRTKHRPRPTRLGWKAHLCLDADTGRKLDALADDCGGRMEAVRMAIDIGLPVLTERLRKRRKRAESNAAAALDRLRQKTDSDADAGD